MSVAVRDHLYEPFRLGSNYRLAAGFKELFSDSHIYIFRFCFFLCHANACHLRRGIHGVWNRTVIDRIRVASRG